MALRKLTKETLKNLKIKINDLSSDEITRLYTKERFDTEKFRVFDEDFTNNTIPENLSEQMITAYIDNNSNEFESGKLLYESMAFLNPSQASDLGLWTHLNHFELYDYVANRWSAIWNDPDSVTNFPNFIVNHWIHVNASQADLIDKPLSGLWWSFYLTIDEENPEDRYHLTRIFFKNESLRTKYLGQANFARYKPAMLGVLDFIKKYELDNDSLESSARAIVPYINLLGGIRPLTYFDRKWFVEKLESRFLEDIRAGRKLFYRPEEMDDRG